MLLTSILSLATLTSAAPLGLGLGADIHAGLGAGISALGDLKATLQAAIFTHLNIDTCYSSELESHVKSVAKADTSAQFVLDLVASIGAKWPGHNCFVYPKNRGFEFSVAAAVGVEGEHGQKGNDGKGDKHDSGKKNKHGVLECQVSLDLHGKAEVYGVVVFQGEGWLRIADDRKSHGKDGKDNGGCDKCAQNQGKDWAYGGQYTEQEGGKTIVFQPCGCV